MENTDIDRNQEIVAEPTAPVEETTTQSNTEISDESVDVSEDAKFAELKESRRTRFQEEAERVSEIGARMQAQGLTPIEQIQSFGLTAADLKVSMLEQERLWDKTYSKYPDLQKDQDLDNLIYGNYVARLNAGERVTPMQIADEVMGYLDKKSSKVKEETYKQAEDEITTKAMVSPKQPRRSSSKGSDIDMNDLKRRTRSGDPDAMRKLLDFI